MREELRNKSIIVLISIILVSDEDPYPYFNFPNGEI